MTITVASSSIFNQFANSGAEEASKLTTKIKTPKEDDVCLVSFGYSFKECAAERRTALEAAVNARGVTAVLVRLEFLQQAWCGTKKFVDTIEQDMSFVKTLAEAPEFPFSGECI